MDVDGIRKIIECIRTDLAELEAIAGTNQPPTPVPPPADFDPWKSFVEQMAKHELVPNEIKPALIAQSIVETGRGTSNLFKLHNNPCGMKWRNEMTGYCIPVNVSVTSEPSGYGVFCKFATMRSAVDGWVRFLGRAPYDGWERYQGEPESFLSFVCSIWAADPEYRQKCLSVLSEARTLLVAAGWQTDIAQPTGKLAGKCILVDPGHSKSQPGASGLGRNPKPSEYAMNALQAIIIRDMLRAEGADVEVFDPDPDSLTAVGRRAAGKHLFLSLHHNAANADGNDEGTETYVPTRAGPECRSLAQSVNSAVVAAINSRNRGVKEKNFTVIATALEAGCPLCMLVESYFIDDYASLDVVAHRSKEAAKAIARVLIARL